MDHIALSEDASLFKQYVEEMDGVKSIVQSTSTHSYTFSKLSIFISSASVLIYIFVYVDSE